MTTGEMGTISTILCPSDGNSNSKFTVTTVGSGDGSVLYSPQSNIMPCSGDGLNDNGGLSDLGNPLDGFFKTPAISSRGIFMPYSWKNIGAAVDGTSNTVAASESCVTAASSGQVGGGRDALKGGINFNKSTLQGCLDAVSSDRKTITDPHDYCARGKSFFLGTPDSRFTTVFQPNQPSCYLVGPPMSGMTGFAWGVYSASSNHTGGVNCALLDGSVHFVSDTINNTSSFAPSDLYTNASYYTGPSGQSYFGVWGAMGSPSGGESVALP